MRCLLLNKPFHVLSRFTDDDSRATLGKFVSVKNVYPAGRLDYDSEGLLFLTDDGGIQARLSNPRHRLPKRYWVQVEGEPQDAALQHLREGIELKDGLTRPAQVRLIAEPAELCGHATLRSAIARAFRLTGSRWASPKGAIARSGA